MQLSRSTNRMQARAPVGACRLRVLHGPDAGVEIALPPLGVVVGADESADVVLHDPAVSRRHCTIVPVRDGFDVTDLDSRNGTLLDGTALKRATVPAGSALRVGSSVLQLVPAEHALPVVPSERTSFGALVGSSLAMRRVFALLERASASHVSVLLTGESGTGKELAARAIHEESARRAGPFVVFDCGAALDTLIESDLFGHVRGAFTGAQADRPGVFELAHGGTLCLDEIGDLPLSLQPKLLRLLETGEVGRLGGRGMARYDVRVIASTHRDLETEVASGRFRGDLFYRLAVVEIHLPPLRQRLDDLEVLMAALLEREGLKDCALAGPNLDKLRRYHFPGNVRELRNILARAVALAPPGSPFADLPIMLGSAPALQPATTLPEASADLPFQEQKTALIARFERAYLDDLMGRAEGNISLASRLSGIERKHLYRLLRKTGLAGEDADR